MVRPVPWTPKRVAVVATLSTAFLALVVAAVFGTIALTREPPVLASGDGAATPAPPAPAPEPQAGAPSTGATRAPSPSPQGRSLDAYRGLGTWVDIFDDRAWADPAAAVADMASRGVRTLYIETGNSHAKTALKDPAALASFVREAHAHGMYVVAWYLPDLVSEPLDLARVREAIAFRTSDGQRFDSFALDIESGAVKPTSARNAALASLSDGIREAAGPDYPLGAIIPSPVGLARKRGYWNDFPYGSLVSTYDVVLPMAYYTYHGTGAAAAYADARANVAILRAQPGCEGMPIHLIGGLTGKSAPSEAAAFVRAASESGVVGVSLYGWGGMTPAHWDAMRSFSR